MNEFTKEELVLLGCWSANRFDQVGAEQAKEEGTIALSHKIQNMIVKYCEHIWTSGGQRKWLHCIKCKANFHHE
jgi:hypothetical protein